jgi:ABC-2 type transport system ATP-binding protein
LGNESVITHKPSEVDALKPIQVFNLTKRFSSHSKSLQGSRRLQNLGDLLRFFKVLFGPKEKNLVALDNISFEVNKGEIFGLLGPNGAGKTTLIKILSTIILQDSGKAYTFGIDIARYPRKALKVIQTSLAEETGFERRLTGRQNLELFADLYGIPKPEARNRIEELLALTGIQKYADVSYNKYSTGTAKRLVVCRVLLSDAQVLIFDEPTTGLDALAALEFRRMLKDILIKQKQKTIIMSSHNLWEVEQLCTRVAILNNGKLIAQGTPAGIRNSFVRGTSISISFESHNSFDSNLIAFVRQISGVTQCELTNSEDGLPTLNVEGNADFDYLQLFQLLVEANLKVRSIENHVSGLEEAFIQLTRE